MEKLELHFISAQLSFSLVQSVTFRASVQIICKLRVLVSWISVWMREKNRIKKDKNETNINTRGVSIKSEKQK